MYSLNKLIGYLANPVTLAWIGVLLALGLRIVGRRRLAGVLLVFCVAWTWLWATPFMNRMIGVSLERPYLVDGRVPAIESYPQADAIELHGGGMGSATNLSEAAEMWMSADRVWHAARLYKAGKAPVIYVTGGGVLDSTAGLLKDFGIPTNALVFAEGPRNTEEEARFIADAMNLGVEKPKVLVVTSAWHMKRTLLMYEKYAPNVGAIPAPCDFENTMAASEGLGLAAFLPTEAALLDNGIAVHEWIGIVGYRYLRK